jgi:hypothetical protein
MMLPPVFQLLKASPAVKAIVGTNPPRIYRHGSAPQDTGKPYVTWALIAGVPENNLSDPPPLDRMTVQVDCWHQTDQGVDALASAVRDAIEPTAYMTGVILDLQEPETKLFRMAMQFDIFNGR